MEDAKLNDFTYQIKNNNKIKLIRYNKDKKEINIPEKYIINNQEYQITELSSDCFKSLKIEKIALPNTIKELPNNCFIFCYNLKSIELPKELEKIGSNTFSYCENLKEIILPETLKEIGTCTFFRTGIKNIELPKSLKKIGRCCFCKSNIEKIKINNIEIPQRSFMECNELTEVKITGNVTKIEEEAFKLCRNLKQVTLPDKLEKIEEDAFAICNDLQKIKLPKNIKTIESNAFLYDYNLQLENFENKNIKIKNNNIYQKTTTSDNKVNYTLTNCNQINDTITIKQNDIIEVVHNNNIKNIRIEKEEIPYLKSLEKLNKIIAPNAKRLSTQEIDNNKEEIKAIYITNQCKEINLLYLKSNELKIYYNGTKEELKKITMKEDKGNIIYKKDINQLLEENYTFKQIDLIMKGYQKGIILSNIDPKIDENIVRDIVTNFDYNDFELYDILNILEKPLTLDNKLVIQKIIQQKQEQIDNIKKNEIER